MKRPNQPTKPWAPGLKPEPPKKEIEDWVTIKTLELGSCDSFTFEELVGELTVTPNMADYKIFVDCDVEHGYYDDVTAKASLKICERKMVPNPSYANMIKHYPTNLKRYETEYAKYKKDLEKYNADLKTYNDALPAWEIYEAELNIKHYTKRLKKLKEKK